MFATGTADRKFCIFEKNRHCARNAAHPTLENGKLAALTSGRPAFQKHAKHAEGSDTSHVSHTQKALSAGCTNRNFGRSEKDHAAQRGRDAFGTATRISASLFRRLSAFFWSIPGQDPKTAKYAVLTSGHAGFPKRVERSEGSNSAPIRNAPCFGVWAAVCDPVGKGERVPTFIRKSECGPFCRQLRQELFCRVVPIDGSRGWVFVTAFERPLKSV